MNRRFCPLVSDCISVAALQIEGGDNVQMKKEHTALVSFTNHFINPLTGAVLTVEGFGLLQSKEEAR